MRDLEREQALLDEAGRMARRVWDGVYLVRHGRAQGQYAHFEVHIRVPGNVRMLTYDHDGGAWYIRAEHDGGMARVW